MLRTAVGALFASGVLCTISAAQAADCPGNPNALGTSRTIVVDPTEHPRLGTMQYEETLPLADHEVVLTFDDGPLPPYSNRVLATLESECVKATYFIVGSMARAYPDVLRKIYAAGHTIGTHSQHHPMTFNKMPITRVQTEVEDGISSTAAVLGDSKAVAPFFRIPGLARSNSVETYLQERGLMLWSADFPADDWRHITANEVINRALRRLEAKGRGILLLHDIQPATAQALPTLLKELKERGYRIVHVVPADTTHVRTATAPQEWILARSRHTWPHLAKAPTKASATSGRATLRPAMPVSKQRPEPVLPISETPADGMGVTDSINGMSAKSKHRHFPPGFLKPLALSN
jgi:peptidoglycan-N-acetylglucosamine deacetylase